MLIFACFIGCNFLKNWHNVINYEVFLKGCAICVIVPKIFKKIFG